MKLERNRVQWLAKYKYSLNAKNKERMFPKCWNRRPSVHCQAQLVKNSLLSRRSLGLKSILITLFL